MKKCDIKNYPSDRTSTQFQCHANVSSALPQTPRTRPTMHQLSQPYFENLDFINFKN